MVRWPGVDRRHVVGFFVHKVRWESGDVSEDSAGRIMKLVFLSDYIVPDVFYGPDLFSRKFASGRNDLNFGFGWVVGTYGVFSEEVLRLLHDHISSGYRFSKRRVPQDVFLHLSWVWDRFKDFNFEELFFLTWGMVLRDLIYVVKYVDIFDLPAVIKVNRVW